MKRCKAPYILLLTALTIVFIACAKISSPSGGPRDRLPPVVVKSIPEKGTKNFREKNLSVTFNEYVVIDKINEKFMVSPPMKKKPTVFIRGKSVNVTIEEELKDSTTYTFYFQDAIRDLNENNVFDNFQFVFSTGPVIDSLSVTGNVYSAFTLDIPDNTLVLLYGNLADTAVVKQIPDYISMIDQNGYFRIDNVRPGKYRLYSLKDIDNSKSYNLPDEEFAFLDSAIEITPENNFIPEVKDTATIKIEPEKTQVTEIKNGQYQLLQFTAPNKNHYLTSSARALKYQMIYTLSLPPDSLSFEFSIPDTPDDAYFVERSRDNDTMQVWITDSTLYSQPQITTILKYPVNDTTGKLISMEDTIIMRFLTPRAPRIAKVRKPVFVFNSNMSKGTLKPGQEIVINSQTPFSQPDTSRIALFELLEDKMKSIPFGLTKDSINSCRYILNTNLIEGKKYLFIADSGSFGNVYNEYCDSTAIKFSVRESESYSKLTLNILNCKTDQIIQLLDNSDKLLRESRISKDGKIEFTLLENGFYRVRSIYDLNGDGKWTTGDFLLGRQPEPVTYYRSEIEIKTGWEVENDWILGPENFKDPKLREKKR